MDNVLEFMVGLMAIVLGLGLGFVTLGFAHPEPPLGFQILFGVEALAMITVGVMMMIEAFHE